MKKFSILFFTLLIFVLPSETPVSAANLYQQECSIQPGGNSAMRAKFQEAHNRYGKARLGCAIEEPQVWNGMYAQRFQFSDRAEGIIDYSTIFFHDRNPALYSGTSSQADAGYAYVVWGPILDQYWQHPEWGPPVSDTLFTRVDTGSVQHGNAMSTGAEDNMPVYFQQFLNNNIYYHRRSLTPGVELTAYTQPETLYTFGNSIVTGLQSPCRPGTRGRVTTRHRPVEVEGQTVSASGWSWSAEDPQPSITNRTTDRRAYDWVCYDDTDNPRGVYAPISGKIVSKRPYATNTEYGGSIMIENRELEICIGFLHTIGLSRLSVNDEVTTGDLIGHWNPATQGLIEDYENHTHLSVMARPQSGCPRWVSNELPILFNEFGFVMPPIITLTGSAIDDPPAAEFAHSSAFWVPNVGHNACLWNPVSTEDVKYFCDVPPSSTFFLYTQRLAKRETTVGYTGGTFRPQQNITRAEMATFVLRSMGFEATRTSFPNQFDDVPPSHTHYGSVHALRLLGIIDGYADNTYKPDDPVTRGQMAKFINNAREYLERNTCHVNIEDSQFTDINSSTTFAREIVCLESKNIISGFPNNTYRPDLKISRGQTAKFIVNGLLSLTDQDALAIPAGLCDRYIQILEEHKAFLVTYQKDGYHACFIVPGATTTVQSTAASASTPVESIQIQAGHTYAVTAYDLGLNADIEIEVKANDQRVAIASGTAAQDQVRVQWTAASSTEHRIYLRNTRQFAKEGTQVSLHVEEVQDYDFADVPTGDTFYYAIKALHEAGLVNGCGVDNNQPIFCPTQKMEREDVMMVLARWLYQYAPGESNLLPPATGIFPDLTGNGEGERAIELAYRDGIVGGFDNGQFKPNDFMTREHAMIVIMRALLRHAAPTPGSFAFQETTQEHTRMGGRLGITSVGAGQPFRPNEGITRAEAAGFLCNALLGSANCYADNRAENNELTLLRSRARVPRTQEKVCFSAAQAATIPGLTVPTDGTVVCYDLATQRYATIAPTAIYSYRADPNDQPVCGDTVALSLAVSTSGKLYANLTKCNGSAFDQGGEFCIKVNDAQCLWRFSYAAGERRYQYPINPVSEYGITHRATYRLEVKSADDPHKPKYSGPVSAWPLFASEEPDYTYEVNTTSYQCGPDDVIKMRILPKPDRHELKVSVQKCRGGAFSQNGRFWILVDNHEEWGPFPVGKGDYDQSISIDPYGARGISGRHRYQVKLESDDDKGKYKWSGSVYAWEKLLDPPAPPNQSPQIDFQTANGNGFPTGYLASIEQNWSFQGTALDPDGQVNRITFSCSGDQCGSQASHSGTTAWQHSQNGIQGRNQIYFTVIDNKGAAISSRRLDLSVDLAAPTTTACLNGECNPTRWPTWLTQPVRIELRAVDGATGRARVDVQEIRYRLDNGPWLTRRENPLTLYIESEGQHRLEYYALDLLGNQETARTITFQVDHTPPTPPAGIVETHGVVSEQWQKAQNTPTFTWNASSDSMSGLWGYQFYFGLDSQGVGYQAFQAGDPRQWTPQPAGVGTGSWYLRGRSRDNAGNWSAWSTLFVYRYDGTPPDNPGEATHAVADVQNDLWQRTVNSADFTWPVPNDEGSGVKGYYLYWGTNADGESNTLITNAAYQSATALCDSGQACSGYLRLRAIDNVDNQAEKWTTAYVLRYDNAPPVADFTINGGVTETNQTLVTLNLKATDEGSGVREMRLSIDGTNWAPWEAYSSERLWSIPAIGRQDWPIYLQVRDAVGLESAVKQRTIYFDVNRRQPRSENFRLFDYTMSAGAGVHESATYKGRSTVGEIPEAARIQSLNYTLTGGYEAGSQAIPLVEPGHDEFEYVNSVFASGVVAETMRSPQYQMLGTLGERGLPNNETTLTSGNFALQPGFLAAAPALTTAPTPTPTPGPTPTPEPEPACAFPQVSINSGSVFTGDTTVGLQICAPYATEMIISNDGGFDGATWEPYGESRTWTITTYGQHVLPRFVYVAFKDKNGAVHGTYFDEIIYDPTPPAGEITIGDSIGAQLLVQSSAAVSGVQGKAVDVGDIRYVTQLQDQMLAQPLALVGGNALNQVDLFVNARDDNSGVAEIQLSLNSDFAGATWEPYTALKRWTPTGEDGTKTLYARFRDSAGNESTQSTVSFVLDSQAPTGSIQLSPTIVGPDTLELTVNMSGIDNLSGVTEMRISSTPTFADSSWLLYNATYHWPIYDADRSQSKATLYVQFRDQAGNVSQTTTAGYQVDLTPPLVLASVESGTEAIRTVTIDASDEMAGVRVLYLSNDPLLIDNVVTVEPTDAIDWTFDENRVVWIQAEDNVGNRSVVYPAYAEIATSAIIPGDGNGDGFVDAGDLAACVLEIFDGDGSNAADAPGGTFAGTAGCDANVDSNIDAGDLACTVLLIFNGPGSCHTSGNVETTEPAALIIGVATPTEGGKVQVPVTIVSNGHAIAAATFALQLGPTFDPTDSNGDGLPDAVLLHGLTDDISVRTRWAAGRLDVSIVDEIAPVTALPDSMLLTLTLVENSGGVPDFDTMVSPSLGSVDGMNVPVQVVSGAMQRIFLPVVAR